jgi:hypothetical protein
MAELNNVRHEKFAQCIASGLSQRKAYRAAFPKSESWKDATVDKRASELMKHGEVVGRLKELADKTTAKAIMTAAERKEWLTKVIRSEYEETKDKMKAVDLLNKMEGSYIEKVEVNGNINNPFEGLTTEQLEKLVGGCD